MSDNSPGRRRWSITAVIPGMRRNAPKRNAIVLLVYLLVLLVLGTGLSGLTSSDGFLLVGPSPGA